MAFTNDMAHWFGPDWPARFPAVTRFDGVLEAAKLGVLKPDPEAFRAAADALGEDPRRCLFVDDLAANLDGARAVGMATTPFAVTDPAGSVARILDAVGLAAAPTGRAGPRDHSRRTPSPEPHDPRRTAGRARARASRTLRRPAGNYRGWMRRGRPAATCPGRAPTATPDGWAPTSP